MKVELDSFSSFFYIALTMLISRKDESLRPEIMYILEPESILQMLDMFGGQKIYIPTRREFSLDLKAALVAYYKYCEEKTDLVIREKLDLKGNEFKSIDIRINKYLEYLKKEGLIAPKMMKRLTDVSRRSGK